MTKLISVPKKKETTSNCSKLYKNTIYVLLFIVYVAIHIYLAFHHEAWRDESQAWIIARNSSFSDIIGLCASEGHPCLWFFFLRLCYLCGVSFYHFSILSVSIMALAAMLFLWKSPFSLFTKICILLSPVFFYYNPVICRVYAVVVLLTVLLCIWWPRRRNKPIVYGLIVAALFQTHILMAGLAIGCLIEMVINNKNLFRAKNIVGFFIPLSSLICMILELRQTDETETFIHIDADYIQRRITGKSIAQLTESVTNKFDYANIPAGEIAIWVGLISFCLFLVVCFKNNQFQRDFRKIGIISFVGMVYYWIIIILVRSADHIQMAIVLWILYLVFTWLTTESYKCYDAEKNNNDKVSHGIELCIFKKKTIYHFFEILFCMCCLLVIPKCICIDSVSDVNEPFSGSLEMANMIEDNAPEHSVIVLHNNSYSTSIVSYLYESKKQFLLWDIDNGHEYTIHKWGKPNKRSIGMSILYETICSDIKTNEKVYYINTNNIIPFADQFPEKMNIISQNNEQNIWNEYYQLVKVEVY